MIRVLTCSLAILLAACAPAIDNRPINPLSYSPTSQKISETINKHWALPPGLDIDGHPITVHVELSVDGQLTSLNIIKSSGNYPFDNSLIRAIRRSIPLPIPPSEIQNYREFEMEFDPSSVVKKAN